MPPVETLELPIRYIIHDIAFDASNFRNLLSNIAHHRNCCDTIAIWARDTLRHSRLCDRIKLVDEYATITGLLGLIENIRRKSSLRHFGREELCTKRLRDRSGNYGFAVSRRAK